MILVVGGFASGKRDYLKNEYGYADDDMADGILNDKPVLYNLQNLIARDPAAVDGMFTQLAQKEMVVCNEIGCGVVPVSVQERVVREATGRACVSLARVAQKVIRVQCGIPMVIKG